MAAQTKVTITHDKEVYGDLQHHVINSRLTKESRIVELQNILNAIGSCARNATVSATIDDGTAAAASGTVTFSGASTANDTFLINGVTFTAVASGATGNQWNVGSNATQAAANLASAINGSASALVNQQVSASAASGVVTITSVFVSAAGNTVTIAKGTDAGSVMTVSGARLTGGANSGNAVSYTDAFGL